jgi:hypothetical protein
VACGNSCLHHVVEVLGASAETAVAHVIWGAGVVSHTLQPGETSAIATPTQFRCLTMLRTSQATLIFLRVCSQDEDQLRWVSQTILRYSDAIGSEVKSNPKPTSSS